jgi:hypothetical protein
MFQDGDTAMQKVGVRFKVRTGFKEGTPSFHAPSNAAILLFRRCTTQFLQGGTALPAPQSSSAAFAIVPVNDTNSSSATVDICQDGLARANETETAANRILVFVDANRLRIFDLDPVV